MKGNGNVLKKGQLVTINLESGDNAAIAVVPGMLKYNGHTTTVSKICGRGKSKTLSGRQLCYIYELDGVTSPYGIPYSFTRDMLLEEGEEA